MANPYSKEKMAWWLVRDGGQFPPRAPKQVQLILSDLCNQSCSFCAYRMDGYSSNQLFTKGAELAAYGHNNPKRFMPGAKALEILEDCHAMGVEGIQFTGGGEPTVHPDHEGIFAEAINRGLHAALVSNGVRWSDRLRAMIPCFAWVRVSIDAGTPETYCRVRQAPDQHWEKAWAHVEDAAVRIARASGGSRTVLGVGFVVTPDNWREIARATLLAKEAGASNIRLSAMFNPDGPVPYDHLREGIAEEVERALLHQSASFQVIEQFTGRMEDLFQGPPDYPVCAYQHYNTYIGADLNVYRCCVLAYNERGLLGSLKGARFREVWEVGTHELRRDFDARGCDRCQFNDKNRTMNYLLGSKPLHAEFP